MPPTQAIQVAVRVRPLSVFEGSNPDIKTITRCLQDSIVVEPSVGVQDMQRFLGAKHAQPRTQHFNFQRVHSPYATQAELYDDNVRHIVVDAFDGLNGAVLAYGATGSGKTHTMFGSNLSAPGVIHQAIQHMYEHKAALEETGGQRASIAISFYEIYNENVYDLLCPEGRSAALAVRDHPDNGGTEIPGLTIKVPESAIECKEWLEEASQHRFVAATMANAYSSRSHAIIDVCIEVRESEKALTSKVARVKMCDLAGSERAANTTNSGARLREGGNINKSLLALGAVVQALSVNKKGKYVPFRGSKLTRLLRHCLGGNCKTTMIACVSPSSKCLEETMNTLHYARQATKIETCITKNEFNLGEEDVTAQYEAVIERQKMEICGLKDELHMISSQRVFKRSKTTPTMGSKDAEAADNTQGDGVSVVNTCDAETQAEPVSNASISSTTNGAREGSPAMSTTDGGTSTNLTDILSPSSKKAQKDTLLALKRRLDELYEEKDFLRSKLQGVSESTDIELEMKIRTEKMKIAHHFVHIKATGQSENDIPPVGIAGAHQNIRTFLSQRKQNTEVREELENAVGTSDLALAKLKKEICAADSSEKSLINVMCDNLMYREMGFQSELLAQMYCQEVSRAQQKESETHHALELCAAVIRKMMEASKFNDQISRSAYEALAYCSIPAAPTDAMLERFKERLESQLIALPALSARSSVRIDVNNSPRRRGPSTAAAAGATPSTAAGVLQRHQSALHYHHHSSNIPIASAGSFRNASSSVSAPLRRASSSKTLLSVTSAATASSSSSSAAAATSAAAPSAAAVSASSVAAGILSAPIAASSPGCSVRPVVSCRGPSAALQRCRAQYKAERCAANASSASSSSMQGPTSSSSSNTSAATPTTPSSAAFEKSLSWTNVPSRIHGITSRYVNPSASTIGCGGSSMANMSNNGRVGYKNTASSSNTTTTGGGSSSTMHNRASSKNFMYANSLAFQRSMTQVVRTRGKENR